MCKKYIKFAIEGSPSYLIMKITLFKGKPIKVLVGRVLCIEN